MDLVMEKVALLVLGLSANGAVTGRTGSKLPWTKLGSAGRCFTSVGQSSCMAYPLNTEALM